jgi:hypothetical protein
MKNTLKVGETVKVRILRMGGGNVMYPKGDAKYATQPIVDCIVSGVRVCGIPGCYSLRFADTQEHVGLPFYSRDFVNPLNFERHYARLAGTPAVIVPMPKV